jgi:hypothetical protein
LGSSFNSIRDIQFADGDKIPSLKFLFNSVDFSFVWKIVMMKYHLRGRPHDPIAMFKALLLKEMWLNKMAKLAPMWLGGFRK